MLWQFADIHDPTAYTGWLNSSQGLNQTWKINEQRFDKVAFGFFRIGKYSSWQLGCAPTYRSSSTGGLSHIGQFAISRRWRNSVQNCRSYWITHIESDHTLVLVRFSSKPMAIGTDSRFDCLQNVCPIRPFSRPMNTNYSMNWEPRRAPK